MDGLRPRDRSPVWLALYSICVVCVFSFVLFEMLDVDGSDFAAPSFKTPTTPVTLGLRQSTTESVRRVVRQLANLTPSAITIDPLSMAPAALAASRSRSTPVSVVVGHTHRVGLPRASLETAPPV